MSIILHQHKGLTHNITYIGMFYRVLTKQGVKILNLRQVKSIECYDRIIRFDYMPFMSKTYTLTYDSEKEAEKEYQKLQDFIENIQKLPQKLE